MQNPNPSIGQRPTPTKWTLKSVITQLVVDVQGLNPRALDQHHDYLRTYARSLQPEVHRFRQALKNEPAKSSAEEMADRDFVVSLKSIVDSSFVHTSSPGLDGQSVALQKMITDVEAMVEAFRGVEQTMKKGKGTAEGSQKSLASNCGDILKADPFATTRGQSQWQNVQPVDSLSDLQLRSRVETYQKMCRKEENIPGATLTEELRQAWILLLANALTFEPAFWSLCNDARQAGGLEITAELQIDALWGLGQFLFAFHSIYDNFEEAWHDFASKNSAEIFARARLEMEELLDRADKQITGKESHSFLARPHSVDPPQSMTTLLSIVQDDTRESILRNRVRNFLRPSEQHSTNKLASSQNLLDFYAAKEDMEPEAVEDHFSKDALALLTSNFLDFTLQPMPRLTLEELSHFKRASSTHYVHSSLLDVRGSRAKGGAAAGNIEDGAQNFDSGDEDALEEAEMGQGGGSGSKADEEAGKKKSRAEDDETPQYAWLKQHFRKIKGPVYLPGWKMSEQTPFSKVPNSVKYISETMAEVRQKAARDSESAAQSAKRKMPLASLDSFNVARMISGQSQYDHTQTGRAIKGAMRDLENAFERGSRTQWNAEHAKKYAAILGDTTNRSKETSASKSKFGRFTETLLYDNWLHVRKFLQGLGFFMNNESFDDFLHATEKNIIMLIAVLQGGVADPTPFILCFDYVLRELWRMLLKKRDYKWSTGLNETSAENTWTIVSNVYKELVLFAHGAAITAVALRFPMASGSFALSDDNQPKDLRMVEWYRELFKRDPRCGNINCNRSLPLPHKVGDLRHIRQIFSVATREALVGRLSARFAISNNRADAYPCLYCLIYCYGCNETLIFIFMYYSHLYHAVPVGCKTARGKHDINSWQEADCGTGPMMMDPARKQSCWRQRRT